MKTDPWSALPHYWLSVGLPNFESESTYQGYPLEAMPEISIELDDNLEWLSKYGIAQSGNGLDGIDPYAKPLPSAMALEFARQSNVPLPQSFRRFMTSPELQSRVRSCTDCYIDPGQRAVETVGTLAGHLIHFLSDSQSCAHWYLHVLRTGESAILQAPDLYCYLLENSDWMDNPACRFEKLDISAQDIHFCAASFSEFLFRFWIENEIWLAMNWEATKRPLYEIELQYLGKGFKSE